MKCRQCGARTRVVHTQQKPDGAHRWLRCTACGDLTRTRETYFDTSPKDRTPKPWNYIRGTAHYRSVLTEAEVLRLRAEAAAGARQLELAKRYGISQSAVSGIIRRQVWTHVP